MEYRQFGKTDIEVSAIGFGCWEIGGTYGRIDESQFGRAVRQAIDNGINCFDTAEAYGMGVSEEALRRARGTPFDETIRALDDIVRQSKARYIGVSNFRLAQIETCMRLRRIDVVQ